MSIPETNDKVWVLSCACGWSRMVPRFTTGEERRGLLTKHQREVHGIEPEEGHEIT